jgi:hypothetical protein
MKLKEGQGFVEIVKSNTATSSQIVERKRELKSKHQPTYIVRRKGVIESPSITLQPINMSLISKSVSKFWGGNLDPDSDRFELEIQAGKDLFVKLLASDLATLNPVGSRLVTTGITTAYALLVQKHAWQVTHTHLPLHLEHVIPRRLAVVPISDTNLGLDAFLAKVTSLPRPETYLKNTTDATVFIFYHLNHFYLIGADLESNSFIVIDSLSTPSLA